MSVLRVLILLDGELVRACGRLVLLDRVWVGLQARVEADRGRGLLIVVATLCAVHIGIVLLLVHQAGRLLGLDLRVLLQQGAVDEGCIGTAAVKIRPLNWCLRLVRLLGEAGAQQELLLLGLLLATVLDRHRGLERAELALWLRNDEGVTVGALQ